MGVEFARGVHAAAGFDETLDELALLAESAGDTPVAKIVARRQAPDAALFVGSDTGPMHLAVAVGTPTISMHGTSRAEWCGAYGSENIRLQVRYQDGSALERRKADNAAMCEITVTMVCRACDRLLVSAKSRQCG